MDLAFLQPLYRHPGPFASLYLDVSRDTADAARMIGIRWRDARDDLDRAGADTATLDAFEATLNTLPPVEGRAGLALFGAGGETLLAETFPNPPSVTGSSLGSLPDVMPLAAARGEILPWMRVVVDHTGADPGRITHGEIDRRLGAEGHSELPIHKAGRGVRSAPRYGQVAGLTWERNATEIAEAVTAMAEEAGAEIVVVAGDPQARPLLVDHLSARWRERVVQTDAGSDTLDRPTGIAVAELADRRVSDLLDRYHAELSHNAAAGTGLAAVVAALQRAQVDTLLLVDERSSTEQLWAGPEPVDVSLSADELKAAGVTDPQRVRADAALVRALAGTDADLVLVQPDDAWLNGGVGAVLRFADAATRHH
ncbi:Vms1/Ankzf1 family peptidyl-tRNA hydrolase [Dactylosporangium fulvum]|uniref:Peptide chain release factor 1 n=1 Tax=Dactylosporangium fulvum TaxID=53359 RepID=A0ABY5VPI8_9ACTN|nr:hypothetical protein [Dactylosporangium fulvum]UWP78706.1 hypothetical protein Dfulv_26415 [Dactylosporangium fulvum]